MNWRPARDWQPEPTLGRVPARNLPSALVVFVVLVLLALAIVMFPHLLGDKPCMEWDSWKFEQVWPRPDWCPAPQVEE